jgi:hypothetical protein
MDTIVGIEKERAVHIEHVLVPCVSIGRFGIDVGDHLRPFFGPIAYPEFHAVDAVIGLEEEEPVPFGQVVG